MSDSFSRGPSTLDLEMMRRAVERAAQAAMCSEPASVHAMTAAMEMAKIEADMQTGLGSLRADDLLLQYQYASVAESALGYRQAVLNALAGLDLSSVALQMQVEVEEDVRQFELLDVAECAGLIAAPSMGRDLEDALIAAYNSTGDPEVIWRLVEAHYDADGAAAIQAIITTANADKDLSSRPQNLDEVMEAHRLELDTLTTGPLVELIESVLVLTLEETILPALGRSERVKHNTILENMLSVDFSLPGRATARLLSLVQFMDEQMYEYFDWRSDPARRDDPSKANRHQLGHGWVTGNRRNTLRCFLLIDVLADVLPALRASAGVP
jgi:hypothetical protein